VSVWPKIRQNKIPAGSACREPDIKPEDFILEARNLTNPYQNIKLPLMKFELSSYNRIVVKIGSSLLVNQRDGLKTKWFESLCEDLAHMSNRGAEILVVSSGAIALGRKILELPQRALKLEENQAAAAVGQIALARAWSDFLGKHEIKVGQVLLTLEDTENRRRYLNARNTISTMLKWNTVPIINENDTVATSEIRYGDNDRLAARVATMMSADLLILLSDIDGLYSAPPKDNPDAEFISQVDAITPEIEAMAGSAGSELSRGGMVTKIEAGKVATQAGTAMVIASGLQEHPLSALEKNGHATWFKPRTNVTTARKKWIAGQLETCGAVIVDEGAIAALLGGKSLLPAGVTDIEGEFQRGDMVAIINAEQRVLGRGLVTFDAADAIKVRGRKSSEIASILGFERKSEIIHRDDMVLEAAILHDANAS
jgi:glutamate 5-kinase